MVIVASYERDPGNAGCLFPVVPKNHPITNTGNHYINAPPTHVPATETPGHETNPNPTLTSLRASVTIASARLIVRCTFPST